LEVKTLTILGAAGAVVITGLAAALVVARGAAEEQTVVRYDRESKYYRIRVIDYPNEGRRCLHFSRSRGIQSSMVLEDHIMLDLRYSKSMIAAMALHPAPKDVLLVGLGGASIPKFIQKHFPDAKLDIVEIDPDVVKVCQEWFDFKGTPNTRVIVMDGRMYLKRSPKQYDIIMLDAYAADRIPFHMTTREFVEQAKGRLKPGGIIATNLWEHAVNRFYYAELRTYQTLFPQLYLCRAGDSGNMILFATLDEKPVTKEDWAKRADALPGAKNFGFDLADQTRREYECLTSMKIAESVLTDDMAPVDTLRREHPRHFEEGGN
jgi:spermidine synthase